MFIRLKKVQDKHYAYHVHNKRIRGKVKQKVKGYIGRAHIPSKLNDRDFFEFTKKDIKAYSNISLRDTVHDLAEWELFKHGLDDFKLDRTKSAITKEGSNVVLKINEGYLYNKTIKDIINFHAVGEDTYFVGQEFAETFVKAGIAIPKELFVHLFEKLTSD